MKFGMLDPEASEHRGFAFKAGVHRFSPFLTLRTPANVAYVRVMQRLLSKKGAARTLHAPAVAGALDY
jgi:hypothetical protein